MSDNGITIEKILALKEEDDYLCLIDPKPKQYLFAVNWFIAEVWNGGMYISIFCQQYRNCLERCTGRL